MDAGADFIPSAEAHISTDAPSLTGLHAQDGNIPIYTRSSASYQTLCTVLEQTKPANPIAVIRPADEDQVSAVVRYCSENNIPLSIRSGGSDIGARSRMSDPKGVMLDMRSMNTISLNDSKTVATVAGGVLCGAVSSFLDEHGLTTPCPFSASIGYVGWICGGGYGFLCGMCGLGVDQIIGGRLVLSTGRVVDLESDRELLWATRGGGAGVLGVVTQLKVKVYPRMQALAGSIGFPLAEAPQLFKGLNEMLQSGPQSPLKDRTEFTCELMVVNPPGSGGLLNFLVFWPLKDDSSDLDEAQKCIDSFAQMGTVLFNTVTKTTPWAFMQQIPNPSASQTLSFNVTSCSIRGWTEEFGKIVSSVPLPSESCAVVIHELHGAGTNKNDSSIFNNREPHLLIGISGAASVEDSDMRKKTTAWSNKMYEEIRRQGLDMSTGYINFNSPRDKDALWYYGAEGAGKIKSLKETHDPKWFFSGSTPDFTGV